MPSYPRIAIIVVYFGTVPPWFQLWLNSCANNPQFDWLVLGDCDLARYEVPGNVAFVPMSVDEFCDRMASEVDFAVHLARPYKVCDFRPLFWVLLQDQYEQYDFWGHCDIDLIFGDLQKFIKPEWFLNYDKMFSVGHLTLYRNNDFANRMYRTMLGKFNWRDVLSDSANRGFDEHLGINQVWKLHECRVYENECLVADIDPHFVALQLVPPGKNFRNQVFFSEGGKVFRGYYRGGKWHTEEFMYIHLQKRTFEHPDLDAVGENFYITPFRFIPRQEIAPSIEMVRLLNPIPRFCSVSDLHYKVRQEVKQHVYKWF